MIASPSPSTFPENPPEPDATKPTPISETTAASQNASAHALEPDHAREDPDEDRRLPRKSVTVAAEVLSTA